MAAKRTLLGDRAREWDRVFEPAGLLCVLRAALRGLLCSTERLPGVYERPRGFGTCSIAFAAVPACSASSSEHGYDNAGQSCWYTTQQLKAPIVMIMFKLSDQHAACKHHTWLLWLASADAAAS